MEPIELDRGTARQRAGARTDPATHVVWIVWAHFVIASIHGLTHLSLPVPLAPWQIGYVAVLVIAAPFAGLWVMRNGDRRTGAGIITLSMFLSLVFGVLFHFVLDNPDNINTLPHSHWEVPFVGSAMMVYLSELAGVVLGYRVWKSEAVS